MIVYESKVLKCMFYKLLRSVSDKEIRLDMKEYQVRIIGRGLFIAYFEKCEIHIKGNIERIEFIYA